MSSVTYLKEQLDAAYVALSAAQDAYDPIAKDWGIAYDAFRKSRSKVRQAAFLAVDARADDALAAIDKVRDRIDELEERIAHAEAEAIAFAEAYASPTFEF